MCGKRVVAMAARCIATVVMHGTAWYAVSQDAQTPYPGMAPLDQYLIEDRSSEIALARSAAPESISRDAEVMVLGCHGYETAIKGTNGVVCIDREVAQVRLRRHHRSDQAALRRDLRSHTPLKVPRRSPRLGLPALHGPNRTDRLELAARSRLFGRLGSQYS
jgi:hypothetical protein